MKKKVLIFILMIAVAVFSVSCTYNENLLKRMDFAYDTITDLQEDWTLASGAETGSSVFTVSDASLKINTAAAGWAYAAQEVNLKSNAYYKITYTYNISSMGIYGSNTNYNGLYIGFLEDEDFNIGAGESGLVTSKVHMGTTSTDQESSFYLKTDYITKATLAVYVGTEDAPVSAVVSIKGVVIERVKKSDVPVEVNPDTGKSEMIYFDLESDVFGANTDKNIVFIVLGAVFTLMVGYAAYMFIRRLTAVDVTANKFLATINNSKYMAILIAAGFAFLIRVIISVTATAVASQANTYYMGFNVESEAAQALYLGQYGPIYMSQKLSVFTEKFGYMYSAPTATPLYLYVLNLIGLLSKGSSEALLVATFLIKLLGTLADIGTIILIYLLVSKTSGKMTGFIMSALYGVLPVIFASSAGWGMSESVTAFLLVLTFYFMLRNDYWGMAGAYFIAFTFSTNVILVLPVVLFYVINQFITKPNLRMPILISFVAAFGLYYAITVPFNYLDIKDGKAFDAVTKYYNAIVTENNYYTANAFNFQALLKNNFAEVSTESTFITILFDVFVFALIGAAYFKNKYRMELPLLASFLIAIMFTFTNKMTPVSMFIAIPLMFIYAGMEKEKRVYFIAILYSALIFVNMSYIYMVTGYTADGWTQLGYDGNAMLYVFGAFNLLLALYFAYVVYDIAASRKASRIKPLEVTYATWVKSTGYRIKSAFANLKSSIKK